MNYNIWNKWDPLEVCMLGNNYAPEFFNGIPDKAGDPLKRICEETLEDLEGYKTILQQFGIKVIQPEMDSNERFLDNPRKYPRGPLQPRDNFIVLGNECYYTGNDHPAIIERLNKYSRVLTPTQVHDYMISSASAFVLGNRIIIGRKYTVLDYTREELESYLPGLKNFDIIEATMEGHTDSNFHPIKPGAILSLKDVHNYEETFPGWDVCYLPDQSWSKVRKFLDLKKHNGGKWWLLGEEDNNEFTEFVETWLQDWVGYVEETVFDVNVLMLDEHHCCVSNPNNEQVNAFLKKHHVEPVYVPWRHRFFWDGGLHCITLDLQRKGTQQDYFSNSNNMIINKGFFL